MQRVGVRAADAVARADVDGDARDALGVEERDVPGEHPLLVEVREAAPAEALLRPLQVEPEPVQVPLRFLHHVA
jgi:hypothetical protein